MGMVDTLVLRGLYPLLLVVAWAVKCNAVGGMHLLATLAYFPLLAAHPQSLIAQLRHASVVASVAALALVVQAALHIAGAAGVDDLAPHAPHAATLAALGYDPSSAGGAVAAAFAPDLALVVCIVAYRIARGRPGADGRERVQSAVLNALVSTLDGSAATSPLAHSVVACIVAAAVALLWPSALAAPYLLAVAWTLLRWSSPAGSLPLGSWAALIVARLYVTLHGIALYAAQFPSLPASEVRNTLGLVRPTGFSSTFLPLYLSMACLLLLYAVLTFWSAKVSRRAARAAAPASQRVPLLLGSDEVSDGTDSELNARISRPPRSRRSGLLWLPLRFVFRHSLKVAILALLASTLLFPSYLGVLFLGFVMMGFVLPNKTFVLFAQPLALALVGVLLGLYVYNIQGVSEYSYGACSDESLQGDASRESACVAYTACVWCPDALACTEKSSFLASNSTWCGSPVSGVGIRDLAFHRDPLATAGLKVWSLQWRWLPLTGYLITAWLMALAAHLEPYILGESDAPPFATQSARARRPDSAGDYLFLNERMPAGPEPPSARSAWSVTYDSVRYTLLSIGRLCLEHAYFLALLALFVFGLARVSYINAGYMLFFIVFVISPGVARSCWIALVIYTESAILLVYFWQFPATDDVSRETADDIGVANLSQKSVSLWAELSWHLAILFFVVLQHHAYVMLDRVEAKLEARARNATSAAALLISPINPSAGAGADTGTVSEHDDGAECPASGASSRSDASYEDLDDEAGGKKLGLCSRAELPRLARELLVVLMAYFRKYGMWISYGVLVVVIFFRARVSVITLGFALLLYACIVVHQLTKSAHVVVHKLWYVLVLYSGVVVIAMYLYQFEFFRKHTNSFVTSLGAQPSITGLTYDASSAASSSSASAAWYRVKAMFGYTVVLAVVVAQLREFRRRASGAMPELAVPIPIFIKTLVRLGMRALILHADKLTMLTMFFVVVRDVRLASVVYLIFLASMVVFPRTSRGVYAPLMLWCTVYSLAHMVFQLAYEVDKFSLSERRTQQAHWLGFTQLTSSQLVWHGLGSELLVMTAILIQHYSERLGALLTAAERRCAVSGPCTLFIIPAPADDELNARDEEGNRVETGVNNLLVIGAYYASHAFRWCGYHVVTTFLVIGCFVRLDIIGLAYLLLCGVLMVLGRQRAAKVWRTVLVVLVLVLFWEYTLVLGLPAKVYCESSVPFKCGPHGECSFSGTCVCVFGFKGDACQARDSSHADDSSPWWHARTSNTLVLKWLGLFASSASASYIDFVIVLLWSLQLRAFLAEKRVRRRLAQADGVVTAADWEPLVKNDFTVVPRSFIDAIRFVVMRFSVKVALAFLFIIATVETPRRDGGDTSHTRVDLISLGYLVFSLVYLHLGDGLNRQRMMYWKVLRLYNYTALLLHALFQTPFAATDMGGKTPWVFAMVGLLKLAPPNGNNIAFSAAGVGMDIIAFVVLLLQNTIFAAADYDKVVAYVERNQSGAYRHAVALFDVYHDSLVAAREEAREQAKIRNERLRAIRADRRRREAVFAGVGTVAPVDLAAEVAAAAAEASCSSSGLDDYDDASGSCSGSGDIGSSTAVLRRGGSGGSGLTSRRDQPLLMARASASSSRSSDGGEVERGANDGSDASGDANEEESESYWAMIVRWASTALELFIVALLRFPCDTPLTEEEETFESELVARTRLSLQARLANTAEARAELEALAAAEAAAAAVGADEDSEVEAYAVSRARVLGYGLWRVSAHNTIWMCFALFVLDCVVYGSVAAMVFPVSALLAGLVMNPRPRKWYWQAMLLYTEVVLVAKFVMQFPLICVGYEDVWYSQQRELVYTFNSRLEPVCPSSFSGGQLELSLPNMLGFSKVVDTRFLGGVVFDFLILLALNTHRYILKAQGVWDFDLEVAAQERAERLAAARGVEGDVEAETQILVEGGRPSPQAAARSAASGSIFGSYSEEEEDEDEVGMSASGDAEAGLCIGSKSDVEDEDAGQDDDGLTARCAAAPAASEQAKMGRDLYMASFLFDLIGFLVLVFGWGYFVAASPGSGSASSKNFVSFVTSSQIPFSFVLVLMANFGIMIADRCIYLLRSLRSKVVLQYAVVVGFHLTLFVVLPLHNRAPILSSPLVVLFYFIKAVSFACYALQIRYGYPQFNKGQFLTRHADEVYSKLFVVYRAIPFVYELRTLLDWICSDTTLEFYHWLRVEEIYANLFMVKCRVNYDLAHPRAPGEKQSRSAKCTTGVCLFILLALVLWLPLLLFSSANPAVKPNTIASVEMNLYVSGYAALWSGRVTNNKVAELAFPTVRGRTNFTVLAESYPSVFEQDDFKKDNVQVSVLNRNSNGVWGIPPSSRLGMEAMLARYIDAPDKASLRPRVSLSMAYTRQQTQASRVVEASQLHLLTLDETVQMYNLLRYGNVSTVVLRGAFARFMHLGPDNPAEVFPSNERFDASLSLIASEEVVTVDNRTFALREWWQFQQLVSPDSIFVDPNDGTDYRVQFVAKSDLIAAGLFGSFVSGGVLSLYLGLVLTIGKFLRVYVESSSARIVYEELKPNVEAILRLVKDLMLSRQSNPPDLVLEAELYKELVQLYRSPEALIEVTKAKWNMALWKQHSKAIKGAGAAAISDVRYNASRHMSSLVSSGSGLVQAAATKAEDLQCLRAAARGDAEGVRQWLAGGASVDAFTEDGYTALHVAAQEGHAEVARLLLQSGARTQTFSSGGDTPLHVAAVAGFGKVVRVLALHDAAIDERNSETGETALMAAFLARQTATVATLVGLGASVNARDSEGWALLHFAASSNAVEDVRLLLELGADPGVATEGADAGDTPLHLAVGRGFVEVACMLLEATPSPLELVQAPNSGGRSALHEAALHGRIRSMYACLRAGWGVELRPLVVEFERTLADPDAGEADAERLSADDEGRVLTALALAELPVETPHEQVREDRDAAGYTPLHLAARAGHFETALALLRAGAAVDVPQARTGETALHLAAVEGKETMMALLLAAGARSSVADDMGHTALHCGVAAGCSAEMLLKLLAAGGDVDAPDSHGFTPLHIAALHGRVKAAVVLVKAGARADALSERNQTPAEVARAAGHEQIVLLLTHDEE
ncbi:uncharacterized protein AMSG_01007 [Thecamonas trahens ATCC 50062]|uniref:EGF-like domain-containing protein n=1 Tax=Thecamonas trahens ATCC 50062 TaxID=461836 RepID=A0A0L0DJD8_THETB|nr:hypothetical protein AMSG_01007 [Thecamonas trahens ATCC 50062]KNC52181.1 hypothetical protein AMSG_01007 [Thecamonas trahens ATCC 50062]|eukprot:XP_013762184.1 hypothetical protein AMSG_01007 [Thecamonas trahens ATCC 50062]